MAKYKLAGQAHLPGKTNCFETGEAEAFSIPLPAYVTNDERAIEVAWQYFAEHRKKMKTGWLVSATLWRDDEMIEHLNASAGT